MYVGHMTTATDIANRIENARKKAGRSVAWLSETAGIADKTLRRRLNAPDRFTLAELSAIASALGADVETFFENAAERKEDAAA